MKKIFFKISFVLLILFLFIAKQQVMAISGACSYHEGVNCGLYDLNDGSVICNDGWKDSSVLYGEVKMCENYFGCSDSQYKELVEKYDLDDIILDINQKMNELERKKNEYDSLGNINLIYGSLARQKNLLLTEITGLANQIIALQDVYNKNLKNIDNQCSYYGRIYYSKLSDDAYNSWLDYNNRKLEEQKQLMIEKIMLILDSEEKTDISNNEYEKEEGINVTETVLNPININDLLSKKSLSRDINKEKYYAELVNKDLVEFGLNSSLNKNNSIVNFIVYGISSATIEMGSGERRALMRDYFETIGRETIYWQDLENLATGKKVVARNLDKENEKVDEVLKRFKKIVGHEPNFKNKEEDLAWNVMMYRLRFDRNLEKETKGIIEFKEIFNYNPTSPLDWATVRALGYVIN